MPLVVFSHGLGGSRRGYRYLGEHFASHGVASLHLQHVGSDRQLWGGNPLAMLGRLQTAAQDGEAMARVQDLRFALDMLLAGDLAGALAELAALSPEQRAALQPFSDAVTARAGALDALRNLEAAALAAAARKS